VASRLRGKAGDDLPVLFLNDKDKVVLAQITLTEPAGTAASFGHLPTFYVRFESRTLPGNIVYLSLNAFFDPARVMKELEEALKANPHAAGVIIDIRGNPGGIGLMAVGIGNWFVAKPDQKLGAMTTREATLNFVLNPRVETYKGPLAILVDGCSLSTSEIMAGGLQDLGRARVFGARTGGAALPSRIDRLPNGDGFQYPFANYTSVGGKVLEGAGVKPDVEVVPARKALLEGRDPALDAAVQWIKSQGQ
jgi:carboxyl-terminal processing protease